MTDFLTKIANMLSETTLESELIEMKAKVDRNGRMVVTTETVRPLEPFMVRNGKPEGERRRFSLNLANEVVVEIHDGESWIPENEATWLNIA